MIDSGGGRATTTGVHGAAGIRLAETRSRPGHRGAFADRSRGAIGGVVAALCLGMVGAIAQPPERAAFDPARFEVTVLASGLVQPMELAVAGDGTVYWLELAGRLMALAPGATAPAVVGELTVTTAQENGLIGLALDPAFTTTGWVYLQYSPPDFPGQRVSRFTIREGRLDPASERVLLAYEEQRKECCHHAGSLAFGPGGDLFIATGDNTHPHGDSAGYAPLDERPERAPWDAQKSSANTRSHNGKILRIHPEPDGTASIPAGNLFPADGAAGLPEIYCMGCRNPWRIAVDSKTGTVYWGEVGPDAGDDGQRGSRGYDEINQARAPGNFGWPYFIADNRRYADHDFATDRSGPLFDPEHPVNDSPNNTGSRDLPPARPALLFYPYGKSAEFPVLGEGGRTACAGPVYHAADHAGSATRFPDRYDNTLFIYEWTRHWIMAVTLDDQERVDRIEPFMPHHPFVRPIDMEFGPGGALYLIEYGDTWGVNANARLVRIDYVRGNRLPVAVAAGEETVGRAPLTVRFTSAGSGDRDGDPLEFRWRVQRTAAGVVEPPREAASGPQPTITFAEPGVYTVEMTATDPHGGSRTASVPVVVGNAPPRVRFAEPAEGDFLDGDRPLRFRLVVDDTEDGTTEDDRDDAEPLTSADVARAGVRASFDTGAAAAVPPGLERMQRSDCFNCHAVDHARVGPPLVEIATKYRGQPGALDASVDRVLKGSAGVWGKVPMLPHGHHTPVEVREMVAWIFALEKTTLPQVMQGFTGEIPLPAEALARAGRCRLEASYVDRGGAEGIPAAVGSATVTLRPRRIEAEAADAIDGPQILGSGNASAGRFIGAVDHGDTLVFRDIPLDTVGTMTLRLASAGAGGVVEVRIGAADGALLAEVPVEVNGQWEQFYERTVALPPTVGRHDVVVRFTHPGQAGGLLNIDTVSFDR